MPPTPTHIQPEEQENSKDVQSRTNNHLPHNKIHNRVQNYNLTNSSLVSCNNCNHVQSKLKLFFFFRSTFWLWAIMGRCRKADRELWENAESFRTHPFLWLYMRLTLSHSEFSCDRASDICAISCLEASRITSGWRSLITSTSSPNRSKLSFIL